MSAQAEVLWKMNEWSFNHLLAVAGRDECGFCRIMRIRESRGRQKFSTNESELDSHSRD